MEKQGMDWRKRLLRPGLLIFISLLLLLPAAFHAAGPSAEEGESAGQQLQEEDAPRPLEIRIETTPASPLANNPWAINVLINHPSPSEVNVKPPRFPPSLVLERVRTETRLIQGERWTRVEFLFTPLRPDSIALDPFEVTVPGRRETTAGINVRFREQAQTATRYAPRFRWQSPIPSLPSGNRGDLMLELTNWDPEKYAPAGFFKGKAPLNTILEESLPVEAGEGTYRYTISIIALEGDSVVLDSFSFQSDTYSLSVPGINIPVLPAAMEGALPATAPSFGDERSSDVNIGISQPEPGSSSGSRKPFSFSESSEKVFSPLRGEYGRAVARVRAFWEEGSHAEALAEIRRNERDSMAGPYLVPLRKEMEQALDLSFTRDETWRPLKIPLISWVVLGCLIISSAALLAVFKPIMRKRKKDTGSPAGKGFLTITLAVLLIGLASIFLVEGFTNFPIGRLSSPKNAAVLRSSSAFRVPDPKGAVNAHFGEGQPVTVGDHRGEWCYAESSDGRSGWVPWEAVITY